MSSGVRVGGLLAFVGLSAYAAGRFKEKRCRENKYYPSITEATGVARK